MDKTGRSITQGVEDAIEGVSSFIFRYLYTLFILNILSVKKAPFAYLKLKSFSKNQSLLSYIPPNTFLFISFLVHGALRRKELAEKSFYIRSLQEFVTLLEKVTFDYGKSFSDFIENVVLFLPFIFILKIIAFFWALFFFHKKISTKNWEWNK